MKKYKGFSVGWAVGITAVVALIIVAAWLVIDGNNKATNYNNYDFYSVIEPDEHNGNIGDHVKTDSNGTYTGEPVYIFEYADFQCPGCASINPRVNQVIDELDGKLAVVYRNDLLSYHQNATAAASAAEAAGLQGYWKEYGDVLFANQADWQYLSGSERTAIFEKYFLDITNGKGDIDKFRKDIGSSEVSKKINFDLGIAKRMEIAGTPAFYVDGQWIDWTDNDKSGGGSVTINGETISWEGALTGPQFVDILKKIVNTKLSK